MTPAKVLEAVKGVEKGAALQRAHRQTPSRDSELVAPAAVQQRIRSLPPRQDFGRSHEGNPMGEGPTNCWHRITGGVQRKWTLCSPLSSPLRESQICAAIRTSGPNVLDWRGMPERGREQGYRPARSRSRCKLSTRKSEGQRKKKASQLLNCETIAWQRLWIGALHPLVEQLRTCLAQCIAFLVDSFGGGLNSELDSMQCQAQQDVFGLTKQQRILNTKTNHVLHAKF